jgi:AcrR family transcriptional regulator
VANRATVMVVDDLPHDSRPRWSARQSEIFDELQRIFLAEGFRHLTIADFVDRLHCSRRTLYSLAPSREELVLAVVDRLFRHMGIEAKARLEAHTDPAEALDEYIRTFTTTLRGASRAFTEDLEAYVPTKHVYDRHVRIALDILRTVIERGVAEGRFADFSPAIVVEVLDAGVERLRHPEVLVRTGMTMSEAVAELSELIRHGLVVERPVRKGARGRAAARANGRRQRAAVSLDARS